MPVPFGPRNLVHSCAAASLVKPASAITAKTSGRRNFIHFLWHTLSARSMLDPVRDAPRNGSAPQFGLKEDQTCLAWAAVTVPSRQRRKVSDRKVGGMGKRHNQPHR